jgi:hypothetical protein
VFFPDLGSVTCYIVPGDSVTVPVLTTTPSDSADQGWQCGPATWTLIYAYGAAPYSGLTATISGESNGPICGRVDGVSITIARSASSPLQGYEGALLTYYQGQSQTLLSGSCCAVEETDIIAVEEGPVPTPTPSPTPTASASPCTSSSPNITRAYARGSAAQLGVHSDSSGGGCASPSPTAVPTPTPGLAIYDSIADVSLTATGAVGSTATNPKVEMVGQYVAIDARATNGGILGPPIAWASPFPGSASPNRFVKVYDWTSSPSPTITQLTDFGDPSLYFYWIGLDPNATNGVSAVSVTAQVSGAQQQVTAYFKILKPTSTATVTLGTPFLSTPIPSTPPTLPTCPPATGINACLWGGYPGVTWAYTVTTPANYGAGQIATAQTLNQLITSETSESTIYDCTSTTASISNRQQYLDNAFPLPQTLFATTVSIANGSTADWTGNDAPDTGYVAADIYGARSDNFIDYLIYQPTGVNSIWVTLRKGGWSWEDSFNYNTTTQVYTQGTPTPTINKTPPADGYALPNWADTTDNGVPIQCS